MANKASYGVVIAFNSPLADTLRAGLKKQIEQVFCELFVNN